MCEYKSPDLEILSQSLLIAQEGDPSNADLTATILGDEIYTRGYKSAAEFLIDNIEDVDAGILYSQDYIIYPVMFIYRHYLELRLKDIGYLLQRYNFHPREKILGHGLLGLWEAIRPLLEKIDDIFLHKFNEQIEARIKELHNMDPHSLSFRYSKTTKDMPMLQNYHRLNPSHIKRVMEELSKCLDTISIGLSGIVDDAI